MEKYRLRFWFCIAATVLIGAFWTTIVLKLKAPNFSLRASILIFLCSGLITWLSTSADFFRRFVGEATPETLGSIRIITCTVLFILIIGIEDPPSSALLPEGMRHSMGIMNLFYRLPSFENFVSSQTSLQILDWLTGLVLLLGILGWQTRIVIPLGFFCCLLIGGILRQYSHFFHTGLIPLYLIAILSCTPCGDGLSLDRLWKVYQGRAVPSVNRSAPIYGWSRYACWIVIALPYVAAGLSKLRNGGLMWWGADNMRFHLYSTALAPMQFDFSLATHWSHVPDILFVLLGLFGVGGELAYGAVLFSRRARWIMPPLMAMMHIGILFFQDILFLDLILLQLIFVDFDRLRQAIARWYASRQGTIGILYDGLAPSCCQNVRLLECLDLFERFQFNNFRQLDLAQYNEKYGLLLQESTLKSQINVIDKGYSYRGFNGFKIIALALPIGWLFTPFLFLPGFSFLGKKFYQYLAGKGFTSFTSQTDIVNQEVLTSSEKYPWRDFRYPLLISLITVGLSVCWAVKMEFYPLTAMQMFSNKNNSGIVIYFKVLAHYNSGEITRAYPEKIIPALYDTRYRGVGFRCFLKQPKNLQICDELFKTTGIIYNNETDTVNKINQFEIQLWKWNFHKNPSDIEKGSMTQKRIIQVK